MRAMDYVHLDKRYPVAQKKCQMNELKKKKNHIHNFEKNENTIFSIIKIRTIIEVREKTK